jgi:hypothetical protein
MVNKLATTIFFFFILNVSVSQNDFKNGIFIEAGGNGYIGSINYERKTANGLAARIGFFIHPNKLILLPLTFGKVFGHKDHHIELLSGFTFARNENELYNNVQSTRTFIYLTGFVGYRYERPNKRPFFRAGFVPLWELYDNFSSENPGRIYPWFGVSGGLRF